MPVPLQPSARYQFSSTGIAPCLQLALYCAVFKYWHESDFSTWGTRRRQAILDENEFYEATKGILYPIFMKFLPHILDNYSAYQELL